MLFVAKATNYNYVTWYINNEVAVNSNSVSGQGTQVLSINPYLYNNGKNFTASVYAVFGNGYSTVTSGTATATVTGGSSTPTPTPTPSTKTYVVNTAICEHGTIWASASKASAGTQIDLYATPDTGYKLSHYILNGVEWYYTGFTMPSYDVNVTAVFVPSTDPTPTPEPTSAPTPTPEVYYSVIEKSSPHGNISADKITAKEGDVITLTAYPNDGYEFKHFEVNGSSIGASDSFVMPAGNVTVQARFRAVTPEPTTEPTPSAE